MTWSSGRARLAVTWAVLATGALSACQKVAPARGEERAQMRAPGTGPYLQGTPLSSSGGVQPGIHPQVVLGMQRNPYANDLGAATEGRRLFVQYNCSGCHGGRAGGGMGPSLRDSLWIHGNSDTQLLSTILEGRSAGMPAWGARLPQQEIWKLITYIRTLGTPQEPDPPPPPANPLAQGE